MAIVSVIVPAYNVEKELPRCLDSLLAQTLQDLEIIVINDGSSDRTGEVIDRYAQQDRRIIAIHKDNGGVTAARTEGIRRASAEYIGFTDGDDLVEPDMFAVLLKNAQMYNADISHCGYQMVFSDGRVHYFYGTGSLVHMDHLTGLRELITGVRVEPGLWNKLYRREMLLRAISNKLMDRSIKNYEDLLMNYCLFLEAESSVFHDICPYHYIVRDTSASRSALSPNRIYDPLTVRKKILDHAPKEIKDDAARAYMSSCIDIYNVILAEGRRELDKDRKAVKQRLTAEKNSFRLLGRKRRVMAELILHMGWLYAKIYKLYKKFGKGGPYQ